MSAASDRRTEVRPRGLGGALAGPRALLPHGGSLPEGDWRGRHRVIGVLLGFNIIVVVVYAVAAHGSASVEYIPEVVAMLAFASLAGWSAASRKWRSVSASMGLLTGSAALVDISRGLIEMHFSFFVVIVVLTLYEDWVPFLVAVAFVLIHHGIMGTIDPSAVFDTAAARSNPWAWAGLHALFVALAGVAGVTAWGLNERVRERMRDVQRQLEHLGHTDALTGLGNRRQLMGDVERALEEGRPAALAIFDLDGFKEYNDRFGHPAGDALLVRLTAALREAVTGTGSAYRLGGDEFCVLAAEVSADALELRLAEWTACFSESGEGFSITASSGVALIPEEATDPSDALRLCDRRMYARKHSRRATPAAQASRRASGHARGVPERARRTRHRRRRPRRAGRRGARDRRRLATGARPRRRPARHRQGGGPRLDSRQGRPAHRGGVGVRRAPPRDRRADPGCRSGAGQRRPDRSLHPRAL